MSSTVQHATAETAPAPEAERQGPSPVVVALRTGGIAVAAVLVAWAGVQAADWAIGTEGEERSTHASAPTVELVADGWVTVRASESDSVEVRRDWRQGLSQVSYNAVESADRLVVTHDCPWFSGSCRAALDVTLPADTHVVVRSSSGAITVEGVAGDLVARTGSGQVRVERVGGDVTAWTASGKVVALGVGGDAELDTESGSIEARDIGGDLDARTASGRVEVFGVGGSAVARSSSGGILVADVVSDIDASTSSGRVTVHGNGQPVALDISTSSGSQTVQAPTDPAAPVSVRIRSSSGAVEYLGPLS